MERNIIVAIADNGAIGRDNQLLWHISEDLKYFKKVTSGHPVIMGRKTFESIGRPLPKRTNIILTRHCQDYPEGILTATSLEEAFKKAEATGVNSCFVIGGGQIYAQAIELADKLYITHVHTVIEDADTFFPVLDPADWTIESQSPRYEDPETGYCFEFVVYRRK